MSLLMTPRTPLPTTNFKKYIQLPKSCVSSAWTCPPYGANAGLQPNTCLRHKLSHNRPDLYHSATIAVRRSPCRTEISA